MTKRSAHKAVVPLSYDAPRFTKPPWFANDLSAATLREYGWEGEQVDVMQILNCPPEGVRGDVPCVIARIKHENNVHNMELTSRNWADAQLIAAAPEMYFALLTCWQALEIAPELRETAMAQAEAAIRKAIGREPTLPSKAEASEGETDV